MIICAQFNVCLAPKHVNLDLNYFQFDGEVEATLQMRRLRNAGETYVKLISKKI